MSFKTFSLILVQFHEIVAIFVTLTVQTGYRLRGIASGVSVVNTEGDGLYRYTSNE